MEFLYRYLQKPARYVAFVEVWKKAHKSVPSRSKIEGQASIAIKD